MVSAAKTIPRMEKIGYGLVISPSLSFPKPAGSFPLREGVRQRDKRPLAGDRDGDERAAAALCRRRSRRLPHPPEEPCCSQPHAASQRARQSPAPRDSVHPSRRYGTSGAAATHPPAAQKRVE